MSQKKKWYRYSDSEFFSRDTSDEIYKEISEQRDNSIRDAQNEGWYFGAKTFQEALLKVAPNLSLMGSIVPVFTKAVYSFEFRRAMRKLLAEFDEHDRWLEEERRPVSADDGWGDAE